MNRLDTIFCCAFAFCISFPTRLPTYCLELYALCIIIDLVRTKNLAWPAVQFGHYSLFLYFIINLVSILLSEETSNSWSQIEKRLSFILIPLIFLIRGKNIDIITREKTLLFFVAGCFSASILNLARAGYRSIKIEDGQTVFDAALIRGKGFFDSIVYGGNYFFYEDYSWFMHPTYFSVYILFAVCVILDYLYFTERKGIKIIWLVAIGSWFLLNIYLLSSRSVLICSLFVLLFWTIIFLRRLSLSKLLIGSSLLVLFLIVFVVSNPRINLLFKFEELFENNPRFVIWEAALIVIKSNPIWGTGVLDLPNDMKQSCEAIGFSEGAELKYNVHNQYLEVLSANGIPGLVSLMAILISFTLNAFRKRDYLLIQLMLIIAFNFLFESMLSVYAGIVFFCFWSCLFIHTHSKAPLKSSRDYP